VTDDPDLEWSAVDGPDGCCWRLCSRGLCVVAKTKGKALALLGRPAVGAAVVKLPAEATRAALSAPAGAAGVR